MLAAPRDDIQRYLSLITQASNIHSPWYQLEQSIKRHTTIWAEFLDQCGKAPALQINQEAFGN